MTTEQREWTRLLAWEGCLNARDLGGCDRGRAGDPLGDGGALDCPAALTEAGRAALADYGVRAIVDLRLPAELADNPNPFAEPGDHGIVYTNVSFIDPAAAPPDAVSTLAEDYLQMLDYRLGVAEALAPRPRRRRAGPLRRRQGPHRADLGPAARAGRRAGRDDRRRLRHDGRAAAARERRWLESLPRSGPSARPCSPGTPPPPRSCWRSWRGWASATAGSSPT